MSHDHIDSATYDVGDKVRYKNHLREYEGAECQGRIIDIIRTYQSNNAFHSTWYIVKDRGRVRSVSENSIIHTIT